MDPITIGIGLGLAYLLLGGKKNGAQNGTTPGPQNFQGAPPGPGPENYGIPPLPPGASTYNPPPGPPSLSDLDRAKQLAPEIEADLRTNGIKYDVERMRAFQRLVRIAVDGMYGPRAAGALEWALGHAAPPALHLNLRTRSRAPIKYVPASS